MDSPIESAEDLAKQTKIKYGVLTGGSTASFFRNSNFSTYQRMWSFMESSKPSVFAQSNTEGVERTTKGKGNINHNKTTDVFLHKTEEIFDDTCHFGVL